MRHFLTAIMIVLGVVNVAPAQGIDYVKAHYTKFEHRIPMRDGTKLFTAVYVPKDESKTYPILLLRTPYSIAPYGVDQYKTDLGPSPQFAKEGYIFVYQDVRGRMMSEGEFVNMRPQVQPKRVPADFDESTDTFDTIDWLVRRVPNNNGKVGQWGISYPGFYTAAGMIDAHPALVASSPQAPVTDWFIGDDFHHNGALFLPHCFNFMAAFGKARPAPVAKTRGERFDHGTPDGYDFFLRLGPLSNADAKYFKGDIAFWTEAMKHSNYDEFWKARNLRQHLKNIKPAVMTVGGWFDAENLFGALETFKNTEANNPPAANHLVMGPWVHGGWSRSDGDSLGAVKFNAKTSAYFRDDVQLPFFEQHLKGKTNPSPLPKALVFETGTNRWRKFKSWPPKEAEAKTFWLDANGKLAEQTPSTPGFDEFISDPAKPVPYIDKIGIGMDKEYMVADQRFAGRRTDVLAFSTEVLKSDLNVAGSIEVELTVATTGADADWIVKVIDVYPDDLPELGGYQQLVRGDVFRGKFRNSFEKPEPFKPGEPTVVKFSLPDICHSFRTGHKLMVQVQSTWFPLVDRNPQTFVDINRAKAEDFKKAAHRVYRDSKVTFRLLP
jgi:putative CocE/NonD family hydrolase